MHFETDNLYHIYNQGNNKENVFFSKGNYLYFLEKIRKYLLPQCDIIAWCLMPNHFHLMVYVHTENINLFENSESNSNNSCSTSLSCTTTTTTESTTQSIPKNQIRDLNNSIGLMLTSYTKALNKQQQRSGSLFRQHTKAECITKLQIFNPLFFGKHIAIFPAEYEYPQICFDYIHFNPVKSGLVNKPEDWEFSSYRDYYGYRNGKLINRERIKEFAIVF